MVSKELRDERAQQLKKMTPAQRKSQVNTWGREYDQGKTPAGPSASYKPTPPKKTPSSSPFNMGFGNSTARKPLANLKKPAKTSYVPNTSQGGFSGRKDPRQQAIENLIKQRDTPRPPSKSTPPFTFTPPTQVTGPVDDPTVSGGINPAASAGAWLDPRQGAWWKTPVGTYGDPNVAHSGSHPVNTTGVGAANVKPGDMDWTALHYLQKYGPEFTEKYFPGEIGKNIPGGQ